MAQWARRRKRRARSFWENYVALNGVGDGGTQTETNSTENVGGQSGTQAAEHDGAEAARQQAQDASGVQGDAERGAVAADNAGAGGDGAAEQRGCGCAGAVL